MEKLRTKNLVSVLVIAAMISGIFALPNVNDDYVVNAAAKKVKVKFNANSGKFTEKKYTKKKAYTKKIKKNKKIGKLPKVKRSGYNFKGWYTKKKKGEKVTKKTQIKKNTTLYARWEKKGKSKQDTNSYPGYVTKAKYNSIKNGMSYQEVLDLIGGNRLRSILIYSYGKPSYVDCYWYSNDKSSEIIISFSLTTSGRNILANKVIGKSNTLGW